MNRFIALCLSFFIALTVFSYGQNRYAKVKIKTTRVGDGIYMLRGAGGSIYGVIDATADILKR